MANQPSAQPETILILLAEMAVPTSEFAGLEYGSTEWQDRANELCRESKIANQHAGASEHVNWRKLLGVQHD